MQMSDRLKSYDGVLIRFSASFYLTKPRAGTSLRETRTMHISVDDS